MSHASVAAAVRRSKEKRPEDYCPDPRCLWALRSGPCPKHPPPAAPPPQSDENAYEYGEGL